MKSSVLVILAAVVLGAAMMFCVGELMKHKENSPGGAGSSRTGGAVRGRFEQPSPRAGEGR